MYFNWGFIWRFISLVYNNSLHVAYDTRGAISRFGLWFLLHLLWSWQAGPEYWSRHLQLYWFRNLDIKAESAEATTSVTSCQEDNEVLCFLAGPWPLRQHAPRSQPLLWFPCECVPTGPCDSVLGFYFKSWELSPYRKGEMTVTYTQHWERYGRKKSKTGCLSDLGKPGHLSEPQFPQLKVKVWILWSLRLYELCPALKLHDGTSTHRRNSTSCF